MSRPLVDYSDLPQSQPVQAQAAQGQQGHAQAHAQPARTSQKRPRTSKDGRPRGRGGGARGGKSTAGGRGGHAQSSGSAYAYAAPTRAEPVHVPALDDSSAWDDSALIDMWDAAAEEFRVFHSRREAGAADDVGGSSGAQPAAAGTSNEEEGTGASFRWGGTSRPSSAQSGPPTASMGTQLPTMPPTMGIAQPPPPFPHLAGAVPNGAPHPLETGGARDQQHTHAQHPQSQPSAAAAASAPSATAPQQHLQNLIMAWYYAGYYTREYQLHAQAEVEAAAAGTDSADEEGDR